MKEKTIKILSPLVGIVFLVSGIGKSVIAYDFSQILMQYGFDEFRFLAPMIIIFEIALGLVLFLGIRQKLMSLISLGFVTILSLGYLYGHLFVNITDCGCFGHFSFLNTPPFFTYLRNFVLICTFLYIFLNSDNSRKATELNEIIIMFFILCTVCFVTGYTFKESNNETTQYITDGKRVNVKVENTALGELITLSKDSTYLIFAFTYSCPHCLNSIENLKQYERLGIVDRVLAITHSTDTTTMKKFDEIFEPNFQILNFSPQQLFRLTNQFPVSYYVKNNTIKMEIRGVLPSGYLLDPYFAPR